ncbi:hypothetical protein L218DRAFT_992574 [Marasmius fiardii PR-910]|nr:hypothetical protein L218DRAFT_992574 [Marasmius fiardii PR-910]
MLSKQLITFALAAIAFAAPSFAGLASCDYNMTPSSSAAGIDLTTEFNYVIGRSVAVESPSHDSVGGTPFTGVDNGDGTFTASGVVGTSGLTDDQLKALVTTWPGQSLQGFAVRSWRVNTVTCQ